jgi:hypothetical protein
MARVWLALMVVATVITAQVLLGRAQDWQPWLRTAVLIGGLVGAAALLLPGSRGARDLPRAQDLQDPPGAEADLAGAPDLAQATGRRRTRFTRSHVAAGGALVALAASLAGPLAWSAETIGTTHTGSIPTVGPSQGQGGGAFGGAGAGFAGRRGRFEDGQLPGGGQLPGDGQLPGAAGQLPGGGGNQVPGAAGQQAGGAQPPGGASLGGPGGAGEGSADAALVSLLRQGASGYRWVAAASSSQTAGPLQLAADAPVMSLGGFSGGDSAITLDQFKAYVAGHAVHYYVGGGGGGRGFGGGPGGRGSASSVEEWVSATFTATTVGGATVYDLTAPTSAGGSTQG